MPVLCLNSAVLLTNLLHLVIVGALVIEVANLILVGLDLEVVPVLFAHGLPLFAYLLHHLQGTHVGVSLDDFGTSLSKVLVG